MASKEKKSVSEDTGKKNEHHTNKQKLFLTIGSIVIFVLATVSFIFLPALGSSSAANNAQPPFGKYNGKSILYEPGTYFFRTVQMYAEQAKRSNRALNQSEYFQIFNTAFNDTVVFMAFTQEVAASGFILPETQVDRTLIQYFTDPATGQYSPKAYAQTPSAEKITLRKQVSEGLTQQLYYTDLFGTSQSADGSNTRYGIKSASTELPFIEKMAAWKRSFDIAAFSLEDLPKDTIATYGKENTELFVKYDLSVITLAQEAAAKKLHKQISGGEVTFADGISQFSTAEYANPEGKLREPYYYYLQTVVKNPESLTTIASLTPGDVSAVIQTATGYSIFKCEWPPAQPDFSDALTIETVHSYMKANDAGKIEDYFMVLAKDFASQAALNGFDAACRANRVQKITTTPFSLNYNANQLLTVVPEQEFPVLAGAGANENFLKTAFSLKQNEISAPLLVGRNVLVFRTASETLPAEASTDEDLASLYAYYVSQFNSASVQSFFFDPKRLQNDFFSVFLQNFAN